MNLHISYVFKKRVLKIYFQHNCKEKQQIYTSAFENLVLISINFRLTCSVVQFLFKAFQYM